MKTRAGVVQITSNDDIEGNLGAVERTVRAACAQGAKLVVVPESFAFLGREEAKFPHAESLPEGGPILRRCQDLARDLDVELILGGFWETGDSSRKAAEHLRSGASKR
ncbi:MAG: nitrilase-related carbon-nitrogen hydrolase [Myxococcota bacterium]